MIEDAKNSPHISGLLSSTFYHFRNHGGGAAAERIYLHLKLDGRAEVMRFVLDRLYPMPGDSNAKVAPPAYMERYDTVVIYMENRDALNRALSEIARFQATHRFLFDHGSPRMLQVIRELDGVSLVGVAIGSEPTFDLEEQNDQLHRVDRPSSSHGQFTL